MYCVYSFIYKYLFSAIYNFHPFLCYFIHFSFSSLIKSVESRLNTKNICSLYVYKFLISIFFCFFFHIFLFHHFLKNVFFPFSAVHFKVTLLNIILMSKLNSFFIIIIMFFLISICIGNICRCVGKKLQSIKFRLTLFFFATIKRR